MTTLFSAADRTPTALNDPYSRYKGGISSSSTSNVRQQPPPLTSMLPHLPLRLQASGLFARRRILSSFLCPPLLLLATAALSLLCRSILSIISGGHPYLTFIAAATATVWFRSLVIRHAPDATKRDDALGKCEVVLPLLSLAAAALVLRTVIGPAFRAVWRGDEGWRPATNPAAELVPSPAVMAVCIRLAVGMATLSLAVASRYLGWFSISEYFNRSLQCLIRCHA